LQGRRGRRLLRGVPVRVELANDTGGGAPGTAYRPSRVFHRFGLERVKGLVGG
jgi:hypothetical protein